MRRSVAILGALVALVALGTTAPRGRAATDGTRGKMAGVMLVTPQSGNLNPAEAERVRATGANTAGITVYWETTEDQNAVQREPASIDDGPLRASIGTARRAGLDVVLHLMLHCRSCSSGWRGDIDPSDPDAFFESYSAMVAHYAQLSASEGVSTLFIGSEMSTVQRYTSHWRQVVSAARARFNGSVVYEANFDATDTVEFWDALDRVSISAYYPLTDRPRPTVAEIKAAWRAPRSGGASWFEQIKALSASTRKPVLFGEVGYRSIDTAAKRPWEAFTDAPYSAQTQANLYQALLETFEPESWWAGLTWWEWLTPRVAEDRTFTPRDKPAEKLLHRWWAQGVRPAPGTVYPDGSLILDPPPPPAARARSSGNRPAPSAAPTATGAPTSTLATTTVPSTVVQAPTAAPFASRETRRSDGPGGAGTLAGALVFLGPATLGAFALLRLVRVRTKPVLLLPPEAR